MKLMFKAKPAGGLAEYHGAGLDLYNGDIFEPEDEALAARLQQDFPGQFVPVALGAVNDAVRTGDLQAPPVDRAIRKPGVRKGQAK